MGMDEITLFDVNRDVFNPNDMLSEKLRTKLHDALLRYTTGQLTDDQYEDCKTEILCGILNSYLNQNRTIFVNELNRMQEDKLLTSADITVALSLYDSREKIANMLNQEIIDCYLANDDSEASCLAEINYRMMDVNSVIRQKKYMGMTPGDLVALQQKGDTVAQEVLKQKNISTEQIALLSVTDKVSRIKGDVINALDKSGATEVAKKTAKSVKNAAESGIKTATSAASSFFQKMKSKISKNENNNDEQ
jgi:hypothetical protein